LTRRQAFAWAFAFGSVALHTTAGESSGTEASTENAAAFSAPGSATAQLNERPAPRQSAWQFTRVDEALEPWFQLKARIRKKSGLNFAMDYASLQLWASDHPKGRDDYASGGIYRLYGSWALLNGGKQNPGRLVFSADHRHRYTRIEPEQLGFHVGYLGIPGLLFHNLEHTLGELNWQQVLNDGKTWVAIGRINPHNVFDVLGYANPWTTFQNYAVVLNTSGAIPGIGTGVAVSHWVDHQWYVNAGIHDINGHPTVIRLFDDYHEIFTASEIGWSPRRSERYAKNIHVTAWHANAREDVRLRNGADISHGNGINIGAQWTFKKQLSSFFRGGWSEGGARIASRSLGAGLTYTIPGRSDMIGLGMNWSEPSNAKLDDQAAYELFYRAQLSPRLAVTPSVQFVDGPSLPDAPGDELWFCGLRTRYTF
jgi:porin